MAYGGTPTTETVNLDEAPVAGACTFLPSIERIFVSLDLAACTYGVVTYAPGGEIGEPIRIFVVNASPNIWSNFHADRDAAPSLPVAEATATEAR